MQRSTHECFELVNTIVDFDSGIEMVGLSFWFLTLVFLVGRQFDRSVKKFGRTE